MQAGCTVHISRCLKEELAQATDEWLQIIGNIILVIANTKKLKNKVVLSLNNIVCIAMWPLVTYSACFMVYLPLSMFYVQFCLIATVLLYYK